MESEFGSPVDWKSLSNASDDVPWYQNRGERKLLFFCSILFIGEMLNGYDGTILGGLLALPSWHEDLKYPSSTQIGLLNAAAYISGVLMGPVNAFVIDRYGRRWAVRWFGLTMIMGTVMGCIAGVAPSAGYGLFVASKVVIGSGLTAFLQTAPIIMQEITHPRNRPMMCALWAAMWVVGNFTAGWVTFGCSFIQGSWAWRVPYLIQLGPAAYILVASYLVPETPRFLMAIGKEQEAFSFFVNHHGNGNAQDELVLFEYEELNRALAAEASAVELRWRDIFKAPGNKHRIGLVSLMTFMPQMNGSNIIQFYYSVILQLVGITGAVKLTGIGAGLAMLAFVFQLTGVWLLGRMRRRTIVLSIWPVLIVLMAVLAATGAIYSKGNRSAGLASVVMVWFYTIAFSLAQPLFYSYPTEILNYSIRGKGMAIWNTVNQAWGAYSSFVNSVALSAIGWKYYLVYLPLLIGQLILTYFYMVETKGYTLEEIAIAFEGDQALVVHAEVTQHQTQIGLEGLEKLEDSAQIESS